MTSSDPATECMTSAQNGKQTTGSSRERERARERESACVSVRDDKRSARSGKYLAAGSRIDQRPTPPPLHRVEQCFQKAPHHVPASSTVLLRDETNMYLLPPGLFWPGCSDHSALALQSTPPSVDHAGNEGNTPGYCLSQYLTTSFSIERACQHAHEGCWLQSRRRDTEWIGGERCNPRNALEEHVQTLRVRHYFQRTCSQQRDLPS